MRRPDTIPKRISELHQMIQEELPYANRERKLKGILQTEFALSLKDSIDFIRIFESMIPRIHHDALPEPWFFQEEALLDPRRGNKKAPPLKSLCNRLRGEQKEIALAIRLFRKLDEDRKAIVLKRWPKAYQDDLCKRKVAPKSEDEQVSEPNKITSEDLAARNRKPSPKDEDEKVFEANKIAIRVLAARYAVPFSTVETYCKKAKRRLSKP